MISFLANISVLYVDIIKCGEYPEASLSGVEPLMQKIHSEIRRVDAGILTAVRQQVMSFAYWSFDVLIYQLSKVFGLDYALCLGFAISNTVS